MNSDLQFLASQLQIIEEYRPRLAWIDQVPIRHESIAHYGCNAGYETLALTLLLKPREVTGVDRDRDAIVQAHSYLENWFELLGVIERNLPYYDLPAETRLHLQDLVSEFKDRVSVGFVEADITRPTPLQASHFDLAYCERVLYQIACAGDEFGPEHALAAIQDMARVVMAGGHIIAVEPPMCSDRRPVELAPLFDAAGLVAVNISESIRLPADKSVYIYRRPY